MTQNTKLWKTKKLEELVDPIREQSRLIDDKTYELWSIPSFAEGAPEIIQGKSIGSSKLKVQAGDVLISKINPRINRVWLVAESKLEQLASPEWLVARIKDAKEIEDSYLMYYLTSPEFRDWISRAASSVTGSHSRAKANEILKREIPLPPLPEQHKIVEILEDHLSRLDAALADVKQAKVKAAQFRRSLLQAAFTGNLGSDGTRLMTSEKLIPFGKTFDILSNSGKSLKQKDYLTEGAFRVIDQGEKFIGGFTNRGDLVLDFGTPIIVFGDHTRNVKLVDGPFVPGADGTKLLRPKSEINLKFAFYQLNSKELRNRGYARHFSELKKESFWIPPLPEQHKIVEILEDHLSRLDASIALADAMEKQSAGLRRSLLQAAFTGQLTKEVASV